MGPYKTVYSAVYQTIRWYIVLLSGSKWQATQMWDYRKGKHKTRVCVCVCVHVCVLCVRTCPGQWYHVKDRQIAELNLQKYSTLV